MLPILIYDAEPTVRSQILGFLNEYAKGSGNGFTILNNTDSIKDATVCIEQEEGVFLMILGVGGDPKMTPVQLEQLASGKNRDSYTLYWLKNLKELPSLAVACLHPVGFVLPPPDQCHFNEILERVMEDYTAFADNSSDAFLSLQSGGAMYRFNISHIDYIEACDKKLNIWTQRQCVAVYEKLGRMEELLGDRFFRCHRSYLVNYERIESVDYVGLELRLVGGFRLPLSRSGKDRLKERISREGLHHAG